MNDLRGRCWCCRSYRGLNAPYTVDTWLRPTRFAGGGVAMTPETDAGCIPASSSGLPDRGARSVLPAAVRCGHGRLPPLRPVASWAAARLIADPGTAVRRHDTAARSNTFAPPRRQRLLHPGATEPVVGGPVRAGDARAIAAGDERRTTTPEHSAPAFTMACAAAALCRHVTGLRARADLAAGRRAMVPMRGLDRRPADGDARWPILSESFTGHDLTSDGMRVPP